MRNLLASALVALLVSIAVSSATETPLPVQRPSNADRIAALIARVDTLQRREALDHRWLKDMSLTVANSADITDCILGGQDIATDGDTGDLFIGDGTEADAQIVAILDPLCLSDAENGTQTP